MLCERIFLPLYVYLTMTKLFGTIWNICSASNGELMQFYRRSESINCHPLKCEQFLSFEIFSDFHRHDTCWKTLQFPHKILLIEDLVSHYVLIYLNLSLYGCLWLSHTFFLTLFITYSYQSKGMENFYDTTIGPSRAIMTMTLITDPEILEERKTTIWVHRKYCKITGVDYN